MDNRKKMKEIIRRLKKEYPVLRPALNFRNPFELLIATILSAQTTDVQVNKVTETLFRKYLTTGDYANAPLDILKRDVSSVNFYNNKASNIQKTAKILMEEFNSEVPKTMEQLLSLPGVARKTANIVLYNGFGINSGIAVDTHVKRLANRLGLTDNDDPVKIEKELMGLTPQKIWGDLTHMFISHGRKVCQARNPDHAGCLLKDICPSSKI